MAGAKKGACHCERYRTWCHPDLQTNAEGSLR
jgi:hypothetical protein